MAAPSAINLARRLSSCVAPLHAAAAITSWNAAATGGALFLAVGSEQREESAAPSTSWPSPPTTPLLAVARLNARACVNASPRSIFRGTGCAGVDSSRTRWPTHRSFASQAAPPPPPPPQQQQQQEPSQQQQQQQPEAHPARPPHDVVYFGPLSQQHKMLKRISITNTLVAAAAAPAIMAFADNISLVSRYGLAASLVLFGVATTGALHWVANPYVHELRYTAATGDIEVRTTTLLGGSRWHSFNVDDVSPLPWNRPVATFMARNHFYYIDVYSFPDEQLLRRLTPDEADVPKGYKDKEDDDDD